MFTGAPAIRDREPWGAPIHTVARRATTVKRGAIRL